MHRAKVWIFFVVKQWRNIVENIIIEFSKANKIGRMKVKTFVQAVIEQYRRDNPAKGAAGRPVSEKTVVLRNSVVSAVETLQKRGEKATTETIAGVIGNINKVYLCNALNWAEKAGKIQRIGRDESKQGKGRKPVLWSLKG